MKSTIRAVSLDAGGTILEPWPSVGHVYADVAREHGVAGCSPDDLTARFVAAWKRRKDFNYTRSDWAELVDQTFAGLTPEAPSQTFFSAVYQRFADPLAWRVFDDVRPTLAVLKRHGLRLAVISNWDERLRPLLGRLGFDSVFEQIVVSCEEQVQKPDGEIFVRTAKRLGIEPAELLHVGDSRNEDLVGAHAAGCSGVLVDRRLKASTNDVIRSLDELPALLV